MLRVARVTDPDGRYYAADLCSGRWAGAGADAFGLSGCPEARAFRALLSGCDPRTEGPLRARPVRVHAYDLTFAAPKSVSVAAALGDRALASAALDAHRSSVDAALSYVAARAMAVRLGTGDERTVEPAGGLTAACVEHRASRALDPHLHTHAVVANLGLGGDGSWRAIDGRGLYAHARAAGALYDAQLRHLLHGALGLEWTRRANGGLELADVDPVAIGSFSARRAEIRAHLFERGAAAGTVSSRTRRVAWAATRDEKVAVDATRLAQTWRRRAHAMGLGDAGLGAPARAAGTVRAGAPAGGERAGRLDEHRFAASIYELERVGVARRDVTGAWAGALRCGAAASAIDACVTSLAPWGAGVGVGEERRRATAVAARDHQLAALGPRPSDPGALAAWQAAAGALDRYRERWAIRGGREPLGVRGTPAELSSMPAHRLADHLETAHALEEARRRLGYDRAAERDPRAPSLPASLER